MTRRIESWSLERIAKAMGGRLTPGAPQGRVVGVSTDTRNLFEGALFVALIGENFDAHAFVAQAADAGARAAVVCADVLVPPDFPLIVVEDTLRALTALGHALWSEAHGEGMYTIALTGSNGKTTTKEILAALWGAFGVVSATRGNLNNHIGVPLTLVDLPERNDFLVVEMGANGPGDIAALIAMAPGESRMVTSIGMAHLEGFGSLDGVRAAKGEIFHGADRATIAVLPFEERTRLIDEHFPGEVWTVGFDEGARVRLLEVNRLGRGGQEVTLEVDSRKWTLNLPLPGVHNALNLGSALATLLARGLDPTEHQLQEALQGLSLPQGRWREVQIGDLSIIDDAYNANPTSVKAAVEAFLGLEHVGPRLAVIGEMLELGSDSKTIHEDVARHLAAKPGLDGVAFVGLYARSMAEAARRSASTGDFVAFDDIDDVVTWLEGQGEACVFLKASRGSRLERIITRLQGRDSRS